MNLNVTRRDCLRAGLALGGALFVGWNAQAAAPNGDSTSALGLWLLVHADGRVTLRTNASEMGQGAQSAMAQIVCEELELPWGEVEVVMAPVEPEYFGLWNDYVTGGSASIRGMFDKLRVAGATARQLLLTAACREWGIPIERCVLRSRQVVDSLTGSTLEVGRLASRAAALTLDRPAVPKAREQWRIIGKGVERLDTRAKINGRAQFGIDAGPKDALIGLIAQAPEFGTKLKSVSLEGCAFSSLH